MRGRRARLARVLLALGALGAPPAGAQEPAPQPKYGPAARRLFLDRDYVRQQPAPDFWALLPYYVPQPTDAACSAAVAVMVVNALRAERPLGADEKLATAAELLERTGSESWKRAVAAGGDGVGLTQLGPLLERALRAYGLDGYRAEVVPLPAGSEASAARAKELLARNEASGSDLLVANFLQSTLTGDPDGAVGHFAPIAAYDAQRRRALILDPDRDWYEPYWVSETALLEAMATRDSQDQNWRGLLWIHRPAP